MDPNKLLFDIRALIANLHNNPTTPPGTRRAWAEELARKVEELYDWLSRGGFKPMPWR